MINGRVVGIGPILPEDLAQLFVWGDDPEIARLNEPYLPKNADRERDFWLNPGGDPRRIFLAVRRIGRPDIAGYVQITAIDPIHRSASLGVLIGSADDRGRGLGRDAMELTIAFCRDHLNLSRLSLAVHADNAPAIALYEKLGFATEGVLKMAQFIAGRWVDLRLMALIAPHRDGVAAAARRDAKA
jgi:RimJ/RimL family protein N-acetyltransferase